MIMLIIAVILLLIGWIVKAIGNRNSKDDVVALGQFFIWVGVLVGVIALVADLVAWLL